MGRSRRTLSREFKLEAVKQVVEHGRSVAEVADRLGMKRNVLARWKAELQTGGTGWRDARLGSGLLLLVLGLALFPFAMIGLLGLLLLLPALVLAWSGTGGSLLARLALPALFVGALRASILGGNLVEREFAGDAIHLGVGVGFTVLGSGLLGVGLRSLGRSAPACWLWGVAALATSPLVVAAVLWWSRWLPMGN